MTVVTGSACVSLYFHLQLVFFSIKKFLKLVHVNVQYDLNQFISASNPVQRLIWFGIDYESNNNQFFSQFYPKFWLFLFSAKKLVKKIHTRLCKHVVKFNCLRNFLQLIGVSFLFFLIFSRSQHNAHKIFFFFDSILFELLKKLIIFLFSFSYSLTQKYFFINKIKIRSVENGGEQMSTLLDGFWRTKRKLKMPFVF